jgi:hypothetical protein
MRTGHMVRKVSSESVRVSPIHLDPKSMCDYYQVQADILVLAEEITNSMRNCGVTKIADLKPEMVGPAGPWVGQNKPAWK